VQKEKSGSEAAPFDVLTVLGHDLKSPLNAVESYMDIMISRTLGDTLDPYMPILDKCTLRLHQMRELITDTVDWSKIQTPSSPRVLAVVNISEMARTVLAAYQKEAASRRIVLSAAIGDAVTKEASGRDIDLILRHLISNAIKYNKDGGSVVLTVRKAGAHIDITVADTGIGLTGDEKARLFQPFVRIKNEKTQGISGTGLGLAIVKMLAGIYDGSISVESEPEKGTTFSLRM
jgi:signal transduction histidine kinase